CVPVKPCTMTLVDLLTRTLIGIPFLEEVVPLPCCQGKESVAPSRAQRGRAGVGALLRGARPALRAGPHPDLPPQAGEGELSFPPPLAGERKPAPSSACGGEKTCSLLRLRGEKTCSLPRAAGGGGLWRGARPARRAGPPPDLPPQAGEGELSSPPPLGGERNPAPPPACGGEKPSPPLRWRGEKTCSPPRAAGEGWGGGAFA